MYKMFTLCIHINTVGIQSILRSTLHTVEHAGIQRRVCNSACVPERKSAASPAPWRSAQSEPAGSVQRRIAPRPLRQPLRKPRRLARVQCARRGRRTRRAAPHPPGSRRARCSSKPSRPRLAGSVSTYQERERRRGVRLRSSLYNIN